MSLLSIIQGVARRVRYPQPATAIGNADPNVALMIDCVQDTGDELVERWGWQALKLATAATFTGDGTITLFPLPASVETLQPDAIFVSSIYPTVRMPGPVNEDQLLRLKSIPTVVTPSCWRVVQNQIEFYPAIAAGEIVSYIYQGRLWVNTVNAGKAVQVAAFVTDADTVAMSERLLRAGARWRWRQSLGLSYDEEMKDYELIFGRIAGQETTLRIVSTSGESFDFDDDAPAFVGTFGNGGSMSQTDFGTGIF